ncbi:defensin-like protein 182 [Argentina anserina]|uniref:defensin-like protein 182 n=1 Tax=Argentina anserina TaxID=57926 RepID=UPI0021764985|nr:defensin-like protein 182 [Potentilla anserina]
MTNHSATLIFFIAALIVYSGIFVRLSMCKFCTDGLGECDNDKGCSSACAAKYPSGEGSCEVVEGNLKLCYCYYNCEGRQPPATICNDSSLGVCECDCDQDCSAKCAAKHPGGQGSCSGLPLNNACQCFYLC